MRIGDIGKNRWGGKGAPMPRRSLLRERVTNVVTVDGVEIIKEDWYM